jgi:hypothetical protein
MNSDQSNGESAGRVKADVARTGTAETAQVPDLSQRLRDACRGGPGCKCTLQEAAIALEEALWALDALLADRWRMAGPAMHSDKERAAAAIIAAYGPKRSSPATNRGSAGSVPGGGCSLPGAV